MPCEKTDDFLFIDKTEINNKTTYYPLKVIPYAESLPTMYTWAPLQKNILVCFNFLLNTFLETSRNQLVSLNSTEKKLKHIHICKKISFANILGNLNKIFNILLYAEYLEHKK